MAGLKIELGQAAEFFARFQRFGGDRAKLQRLLGDDKLMEAWIGQLDGSLTSVVSEYSELIHSVYNPSASVLASFKARCAAKRIKFGKFSWNGSERAPEYDPNDPETVVVLDATLGTLKRTFEFSWEWAADGQVNQWRWDGMISDASSLRLLSDDRPDDAKGDGPEFKPWSISWRRIKLDTSAGRRPIDVRDPKSSPGCALLFMAAQHPERIKATDYKKRFGFWLPGLKCTAPEGEAWGNVPCVRFNRDDRRVGLYSGWDDLSYGDLAVPSFRE